MLFLAKPVRAIVISVFALVLASCASIGPGRIDKDQFDYNSSVSSGWQEQMLLNFVKLRYGDTPVFLEVTSIVNQYQLESSVALTLTNSVPNSQALGGKGTYIDKPTISYKPILGEAFTRSLLTPIPPATVFSLIQAGWPADLVFRLVVRSINGIGNTAGVMQGQPRQADPSFQILSDAMRRIQLAGGVGLRIEKIDDRNASLITFRTAHTGDVEKDVLLVRKLLEIAPEQKEIPLVFGAVRQTDRELAMLSRSMLDVMSALAAYIDVPEEHVSEGRASPNLPEDALRLVRVNHSSDVPEDAFVSVPYRGKWFWIADTDLKSKHMLSVMVLLFSLAQTESSGSSGPVLTIPAG